MLSTPAVNVNNSPGVRAVITALDRLLLESPDSLLQFESRETGRVPAAYHFAGAVVPVVHDFERHTSPAGNVNNKVTMIIKTHLVLALLDTQDC